MNANTEHTHHIIPLNVYLAIGTALLVFTGITVAVAMVDLGPFNLIVAMIIATFKASLVALFFMHLYWDNKIYLVAFLSSLFFLGIFIVLTMFDTLRRGDIYPEIAQPIKAKSAMYDSLKTTPPAENQH